MVYAIHGILELEPAYCSFCEKAVIREKGVLGTKLGLTLQYFTRLVVRNRTVRIEKDRLSHLLCIYRPVTPVRNE